ncbi:MAG TPA: sigma-54 dependent transcriptional regulator [Polyangia bacterium]|nr:sigma-54 dependent transcriptional regulator [Polyangia bacterium]
MAPAETAADRDRGAVPEPRACILVVEDDAAMRDMLREALEDDGYAVEAAAGGRAGVERVRRGGVDLVISDVKMPDLDGLDMLREIKAVSPSPHVITITAFGSIDTAIRAVKLGAFDYITKPFEIDQLILSVEKALAERALRSEVIRLRAEVQRSYRFDNIIGKSAPMQEVFGLIRRLSGSAAAVLVTGESGTGKELVAKSIHYNSPRAGRPFVPLNCAAIPDALLESELFGYKRGAFTDARADRAGLFVEADGGTIFLDEIAELSPALQAKLLRVLQEGEIRPLGAARAERVDVRVIAATNRDLEKRLETGAFRADLYYRLNVIHIHLPPLRARAEDLLPLAEHFLGACAARARKEVRALDESAKKAILGHAWPGNVRELENTIERAVALCEGGVIRAGDLPTAVRERRVGEPDTLAVALARGLTLADVERDYIQRVVTAEGGNKTRAAQRLGLDRKTLYRKLEEYAAATGQPAEAAKDRNDKDEPAETD